MSFSYAVKAEPGWGQLGARTVLSNMSLGVRIPLPPPLVSLYNLDDKTVFAALAAKNPI